MKVVEFIGGLGNQLFCYAYYDFLKKKIQGGKCLYILS